MGSAEKKLRCIIIGAGVSGILIAQKLQEKLRDKVVFHIFEKNHDVGGTWLENRYPGCACDVPSHIYQYSFCPNPNWSRIYAPSGEIQSYLKAVVFHYGLEKHISFRSKVNKLVWDDSESVWHVDIDGQKMFECDILFNASGILNDVYQPQLKNLHTFTGQFCHTAAWDTNLDLKGKRVAIVGAGASAIQLLPAIQDDASHVDVYIRTPSWITPPSVPSANGDVNRAYSEEEKHNFRTDAEYSVSKRKEIETMYNGMFKIFHRDSTAQKEIRARLEESMRHLITKTELIDPLVPKFDVGCRRINPGVLYLKALQLDHVQPVFGSIDEVTPTSIRAGGVDREVDIIIAATGFNTSFIPRFPIIGETGQDLRELWAQEPEAYMGLAVAGFPNYLTFLGPNTPIANGSLMGVLEATADFFVRLLEKKIKERIVKFSIRPEAQKDFDQHTQRFMKNMVWTGPCNSWYKDSSGKITAIWPGSSLHYIQALQSNRWEDWQWTYQSNRFDWWGQGVSDAEQADDADLAYYIDHHDPLPLHAYTSASFVETHNDMYHESFMLRDLLEFGDSDQSSVSSLDGTKVNGAGSLMLKPQEVV